MASAGDILQVRRNTNEPDTSGTYSDSVLSNMIDELGLEGASAAIWSEKAATYAELVDTTEAGASHKFSNLHQNALRMAAYWHNQDLILLGPERTRVKQIER